MYDDPSELLAEIRAGEDSFLEFKELIFEGTKILVESEGRAAPWIGRQLCAFTNTDGGVLLFGIAKSGTAVGIPHDRTDEVARLIFDIASNSIEPPLDHLVRSDAMELPTEDGSRIIIKVDILPDYQAVHAVRGARPHIRSGNTTREVSMEYLPRLLARRGSLTPVDERPVVGASLDDLDETNIQAHYRERFGSDHDDYERLLRNWKLASQDEHAGLSPTVAGLLLFAKNEKTQHYIGGARIDLAAYDSVDPDTDARIDSTTFGGTVMNQLDEVTNYLRTSPFLSTPSNKDDLGRVDRPIYSMRALQEAVVNAVAHRDYAVAGSQCRLQIFTDRIEVTSPGRLQNSLTPDDLYAGAQPFRRNQVLVGFLVQLKSRRTERRYMENMGEGFLTIVRESERISGRRPDLIVQGDSVKLVIYAGDRL